MNINFKEWNFGGKLIFISATLAFLSSKSVDLFGNTVNAAGIGLYLFIIASVLLIIGVFQYKVAVLEEIDTE